MSNFSTENTNRESGFGDWLKIYDVGYQDDGIVIKKYLGRDAEVVVPDMIGKRRVIAIGREAFSSCGFIVRITLPEGLRTIGERAFKNCRKLNRISIPSTLTHVGLSAFEVCDKLKRVDIADVAAWCNISFEYADANPLTFANTLYLRGKRITELVIPESVEEIYPNTFTDCRSITTLTMGSGVRKIGTGAFSGCINLVSVSLPDTLELIGSSAFSDCTSVVEVNVPCGTREIGAFAFLRCSALVRATLSDTVEKIGLQAFGWCTRLAEITMPAGVREIENGIFIGCKKPLRVTLPDGIESFDGSALEVIWNAFELSPAQVGMLAAMIVQYPEIVKATSKLLTKIKWIKNDIVKMAITSSNIDMIKAVLSLYKSVRADEIDEWIEKCGKRPEIRAYLLDYKNSHYTQKMLNRIENEEIEMELGLRERSVEDWKRVFKFRYLRGNILIQGYLGKDTEIVIPEKIGKRRVVGIDTMAFVNDEQLKKIVISQGVQFIGEYAFYTCRELRDIYIPESVVDIGDYCFENCRNIVVHAKPGSKAWFFAMDNGFTVAPEPPIEGYPTL